MGTQDTAFQVFVLQCIKKIQQDAQGRSPAIKNVRQGCGEFLDGLEKGTINISTPLSEKGTSSVLRPLELAIQSGSPRVMEPALGCIHKLVAHAWVQGESSQAGRLTEASLVAKITRLLIACGATTDRVVQLSVIQGLLTITTAEHFLAHGESLMAAVRVVFNLAVGSEDSTIKRTACNALLQMLNTILKRVTQPALWSSRSVYFGGSELSVSVARNTGDSVAKLSAADPHSPTASPTHPSIAYSQSHNLPTVEEKSQERVEYTENVETPDSHAGDHHSLALRQVESSVYSEDLGGRASCNSQYQDGFEGVPSWRNSGDVKGDIVEALQDGDLTMQQHIDSIRGGSTNGASVQAANQAADDEAQRAASLYSLAEAKDVKGIEKHLQQHSPETLKITDGVTSQELQPHRVAQAALMQQDNGDGRLSSGTGQSSTGSANGVDMQESLASIRGLNVMERDVLLVLAKISQLAARDDNACREDIMRTSRLLALELLAKVLDAKGHTWDGVRNEFMSHLRQPLCLLLLRNSQTADMGAFSLIVSLFVSLMNNTKLRADIKTELGAFYPLLLLRPLESGAGPAAGACALVGIRKLFKVAQMQVDIFLNYDCDLNAANLFERTIKVLKNIAVGQSVIESLQDEAVACLCDSIRALDEWAGPVKEQVYVVTSSVPDADASIASKGADVSQSSASLHSQQTPRKLSLTPGQLGDQIAPDSPQKSDDDGPSAEVARFEVVKLTKGILEQNLALFESKPIKSINKLIESGLLDNDPTSVAQFFVAKDGELSKAAVGEVLGHHEDFYVDVMHAFVEMDDYSNLPIDEALRKLLGRFHIPGEAQKIDRIVLKFSEMYCRHNPTMFKQADDAYLLAFSIIMLNTDAHHPMAERRLTKETFVIMNEKEDENGEFSQILPTSDLEAIFDRVVARQFTLRDPNSSVTPHGNAKQPKRESTYARLSSALGFAPMGRGQGSGSGSGVWNKSQVVGAEQQQAMLYGLTRQAVARVGQVGSTWYAGSHAEHIRPMMQVAGLHYMEALFSGLITYQGEDVLLRLLAHIQLATDLCLLLGLDWLAQSYLTNLAQCTGVYQPAIPSDPGATRQLLCLQALLEIAAGKHAGLLGDAWGTVIKYLSTLETLGSVLQDLTNKAFNIKQSSQTDSIAASIDASTHTPCTSPHARVTQLSSRWKIPAQSTSTDGAAETRTDQIIPSQYRTSETGTGREQGVDRGSADGGLGDTFTVDKLSNSAHGNVELEVSATQYQTMTKILDKVKAQVNAQNKGLLRRLLGDTSADATIPVEKIIQGLPGGHLVVWCQGGGSQLIEAVFQHSRHLPAQAVVIFFKQLADVSKLELTPLKGRTARVFCLQKLVECAYVNMDRIRLVWGRIWNILGAHLVSTSCHGDSVVACYAVDSLRQMVSKLLERVELARFTFQDEAIRPFVTVLRKSPQVEVKTLVLTCCENIVKTQGTRLGSGWKRLLEVLCVGATDSSAAVVQATLDVLGCVLQYVNDHPLNGQYLVKDIVLVANLAACNRNHIECVKRAVQILCDCAECVHHIQQEQKRGSGSGEERVVSGGEVGAGHGDDGSLLRQLVESQIVSSENVEWYSSSNLWAFVLGALSHVGSYSMDDGCNVAYCAVSQLVGQHGVTWDNDTWIQVTKGPIVTLFGPPDISRYYDVGVPHEELQDIVTTYFNLSQQHFPPILAAMPPHILTTALPPSPDTDNQPQTFLQFLTDMLTRIVEQPHAQVSHLGILLFRHLIASKETLLTEADWHVMLNMLHKCGTQPTDCMKQHLAQLTSNTLTTPLSDQSSLREQIQNLVFTVQVKSSVALEVQRTLSWLNSRFASSVPSSVSNRLLEVQLDMHQRAVQFNSNGQQRRLLTQLLRKVSRRQRRGEREVEGEAGGQKAVGGGEWVKQGSGWVYVIKHGAGAVSRWNDAKDTSGYQHGIGQLDQSSGNAGVQGIDGAHNSKPLPVSEVHMTGNDGAELPVSSIQVSGANSRLGTNDGTAAESEGAEQGGEQGRGVEGGGEDTQMLVFKGKESSGHKVLSGNELMIEQVTQYLNSQQNVLCSSLDSNSAGGGVGREQCGTGLVSPGTHVAVNCGAWSAEEQLQVALVRQEVEGGIALIHAVQHQMGCLSGVDVGLSEQLTARLQKMCISLLIGNTSTEGGDEGEGRSFGNSGGGGVGLGGKVGKAGLGGACGELENGGGYKMSGGTCWEDTLRAPLTIACIDTLRSIPPEQLSSDLKLLFPRLAQLILTKHVLVRSKLAEFMSHILNTQSAVSV